MRFRFCPQCGSLLGSRELGDEGTVPWCEGCGRPWFDMFSTCVISLVYDDECRVLLLHQEYIHPRYLNLVSGYMTPGENAETAARREIKEETGLDIDRLEMAGTWWFGRKDMLMIGFLAHTPDSGRLSLSGEVDSAAWYPASDAPALVHPEGSVSYALAAIFANRI